MWGRIDNQEVGLEAAILERVRNSSLVKWFRADNVAGLKHTAEAVASTRDARRRSCGGGVQVCGWVGERRAIGEAVGGPDGGGGASENAGMSSA
jgi:hypothetical protein